MVYPAKQNENLLNELKNWDLWGPLVFCLVLSVSLSWHVQATDNGQTFSIVFYLFWLGSGIVTLNTKLLNGQLSFFQSLSALGYCLFPLVVASLFVTFVLNQASQDVVRNTARFIVVLGCLIWANKAAIVFMTEFVSEKRRLLAVYPVTLLYSAFSLLILTYSGSH